MPQFGVCTSVENAPVLREQGWEFIEPGAQGVLQGTKPDEEWQKPAAAALPTPSANSLVPGRLKIVGPDVDEDALHCYMANTLRRAGATGIKTLVFGSGDARKVPDGFDRDRAERQITAFLTRVAPVAAENGVMVVIEPLNRGETNILNSVGESMGHVRAVNHPGVQCLVDSYHFWLEDEPLENLRAAMPNIKHVHVADRDGRTTPGDSGTGTSDYQAFFGVLKRGGYDGGIAVEARGFDDHAADGPRVLKFLKDQWASA